MQAPRGYTADGDIIVSRFVMADGTKEHRVIQADGSGPIIGISQEGGKYAPLSDLITTDPPKAAEADDPVNVYIAGTYALVEAGGTVAAGDLVKSDANGKAIKITQTAGTKEYVGGQAETGGASGAKVLVRVQPQVLTTET